MIRLYAVPIMNEEKIYRLGYFKKEKDAALAYNKKAIELYGEFAILNHLREIYDARRTNGGGRTY